MKELISVVGPTYYPHFCEDLGGGLRAARFSDPKSDTDLCIIWFPSGSQVICTRACIVNESAKPNEDDLWSSLEMMSTFRLDKESGGKDVN